MPVELQPVVLWIFQEENFAYLERRDELVRAMTGAARSLLALYARPERSGVDPVSLVYAALYEMQRKLLGQHLPEIEVSRKKSVGVLWPAGDKAVLKVVFDRNRLHSITPLPRGNGTPQVATVEDGRSFAYKFYRNDTMEQRRTWVYQLLEAEARSLQKSLKEEEPLDDAAPVMDPASTRDSVSARDEIRKWRGITDLDDWKDAEPEKGKGGTARKRGERARMRLRAAYRILVESMTGGAARVYLERLKQCADGKRKTVLEQYLRRYEVEET